MGKYTRTCLNLFAFVTLFVISHQQCILYTDQTDLYLYMKKDGSIVAVLLDNVENMFKHPRADTKSSVRRQAPQGHYVELQLTVSNLTLLLGV